MSKPAAKSKEELEKEQQAAKEEITAMLEGTRPKNLRAGITSGLGNVVAGAVGGCGMVVLSPIAGAALGKEQYGVAGAAAGLVGGAVVGVVGGAAMIVGGAVQGITQFARGAKAVPSSVMEPRRGKWWNDAEGVWVLTDLGKETTKLSKVPDDDNDILQGLDEEKDAEKENDTTASKVKDMEYYDVLDVAPDAEPSKIKRQYYVLARKYHPDKVDKDDVEAADKFKDIAEAYQVLSDPELRQKYNAEGKEGLSPDRTDVADGLQQVDPAILFAFLFGSAKAGDYVGRLAMATSAIVGDSPKVGRVEARTLQKRRVARLAVKLAERLKLWTEGDIEGAQAAWKAATDDLTTASFGSEMVQLIGKVYSLSAVQFLGSRDSGVGMPSISHWAKSHYAGMKQGNLERHAKMDTMVAGMNMMKVQQKAAEKAAKATTESQRKLADTENEQNVHEGMLNMMWTTTVVDITSTLHETIQMVLFDQSVSKEMRKQRAEGLKVLGGIMIASKKLEPDQPHNAQKLYEEAAFAAMLETIQRKEEAAQKASIN